MQVYVDRGGERFGPYSLEEVKASLANGTLLSTDHAWHDGMTDWVPIGQIPGVTMPGDSTPSPSSADPAAEVTCPQCQAPVEVNQVICMGCGTRLQGEPDTVKGGKKKLLIGIGVGIGALAILAGIWLFLIRENESKALSNNNSKNPTTNLTLAEKIIGEYDYKRGGYTYRWIFLKNGVAEGYSNGERDNELKWEIVDGEIHIVNNDSSRGIYRINEDGSFTWIKLIDKDGKKENLPKEAQQTFKRIKKPTQEEKAAAVLREQVIGEWVQEEPKEYSSIKEYRIRMVFKAKWLESGFSIGGFKSD